MAEPRRGTFWQNVDPWVGAALIAVVFAILGAIVWFLLIRIWL